MFQCPFCRSDLRSFVDDDVSGRTCRTVTGCLGKCPCGRFLIVNPGNDPLYDSWRVELANDSGFHMSLRRYRNSLEAVWSDGVRAESRTFTLGSDDANAAVVRFFEEAEAAEVLES